MWRIRGVLRDYDWGPVDGLATWSRATGGPQAELWFGLHPSAPSPVVDEAGTSTGLTLDQVMPGPREPLMLKLLAAQRPLSIQVHPTRDVARTLHAQGLLPDDEPKAETLLALSPFSVHAGWRDLAQAQSVLLAAGISETLVEAWPSRAAAVRGLLELDRSVVTQAGAALPAAAKGVGLDDDAVAALQMIAADYPTDAGVLVCVLMQHLVLAPGQAIDVPPGLIHSYVQGLGVEVMTSSDNVLRLGLTSKPVHVDEALGALRDLDEEPPLPFTVSLVSDGTVELPSAFRIVLPLDGDVDIAAGDRSMSLEVGLAGVMGEDEPACRAVIRGTAVIATGL